MLLLGIITLVMTIPLASHLLSTISLRGRIILLIFLYGSLLAYHMYNILPLSAGIAIFEGLFQLTLLSQMSISWVLAYSFLGNAEILLSSFVPIMIYHNSDSNKSWILSDLKGRAGIYMWTHIGTGRIYIGSAVDLSKRLTKYFSSSGLKEVDNYISKALVLHTHSVFSLSILDYIDISDLSKEEARESILNCKQFFLDSIFLEDVPNTYNILQVAGSSLGYKHTEESLAKFSGKNHPRRMLGKTLSAEIKVKISEAKLGENNPMFGKTGENHPFYGKTHSPETLAKMSITKSGKIILCIIEQVRTIL